VSPQALLTAYKFSYSMRAAIRYDAFHYFLFTSSMCAIPTLTYLFIKTSANFEVSDAGDGYSLYSLYANINAGISYIIVSLVCWCIARNLKLGLSVVN